MPLLSPVQFFRDFCTILASGCFEHRAYARLHLRSVVAAPAALPHYMLRGEALGHRPCPFFDPVHHRKALADAGRPAKPSRNLFAAFLRNEGRAAPCAEFDPVWYLANTPEAAASGLSPWRHLARRGIAAMRDPGPDVWLAFVWQIYGHSGKQLPRLLMKLFDRRRRPNGGTYPLSEPELRRAQQRFRDGIAFEVRAQLDAPRQRDLVFVQTVGGHGAAIEGGRYDLMLNYYASPPAGAPQRAADYVVMQNGTKATAIDTLLKTAPELLLRYDYVLFLDDDVEIGAEAVEELFRIMRAEGLDCAQPALTEDSFSHYTLLKAQPGGGVRRLNAVEIMMPALSRRALETCGWVFGETISGYGVDLLLGPQVRRHFGETVAVVDAVAARHAGRPDLESGTFYSFLARHDISAIIELNVLRVTHELPETIEPVTAA